MPANLVRPITLCSFFLLFSLAAAFAVNDSVAFFVLTTLPSGARCNETAASECFYRLYTIKAEACGSMPRFTCVDYTFLDKCFRLYAGLCNASSVAHGAITASRRANHDCLKRHKHRHAVIKEVVPFTGEGRDSRDSIYSNNVTLLHVMISTLGSVQQRCAESFYENCSNTHVDSIINECEHGIQKNKKETVMAADFDRHKLLRIRLDTSKKLLQFAETSVERECLTIRSTLTELYQIHNRHCYHSVITRCMCEHNQLERLCSIRCDVLEAESPDEHLLAWDDFKGILVRSSKAAGYQLTASVWILAIAMIVKFAHFH